MKSLLLLCLALALSACETMKDASQTQRIAAGCATVSASLKVLTVAVEEGHLTVAQKAQVSAAAHELTPVCAAATPPTLDDVKMIAFERAVSTLRLRAAGL